MSELWSAALKKSSGPCLFGHFTLADAFFAPVVMCFKSYGVELKDPLCRKYSAQILKNSHVKEWIKGAKKETPLRVKI